MNGKRLLLTASTIAMVISFSLIGLIVYLEGDKNNDVVDNKPNDNIAETPEKTFCSTTTNEYLDGYNANMDMTAKVIFNNNDKVEESVLEIKYSFQTEEEYKAMKESLKTNIESEMPGVVYNTSYDDINLIIVSTTTMNVMESESADGNTSINLTFPSDAGKDYFINEGYTCN